MIRLIRTAGVLLGLFVFIIAPLQAQTTVFINEIHYDNDGTDEGESIEIAGPAGTDLTGWEIVLYNGSSGVVYDTDALVGTIPDDGSGFGFVTVSYPSNGIQNGSPDGIVLSDGANVIQFLSYEGSFTATDGIANGLTSTDIGVTESGGTPIGNSMQLTGTGAVYEDFTWVAELASTFDAVNDGQTFESTAVEVVFINEIHYDNDGTDEGEEIEIAGTAGTDLTGWEIILYNGSSGVVYDTDALAGTIPDDGSGFGFVTISYPSNGIQNGAPDGIVLSDGANVIQFLSYEGSFTATDGIANGLTSTDIGVSESGGTPIGNSLQLVGTGTQASDFTWATDMPSTFGAVNTGQVFGTPSNFAPVVTITSPNDGDSFEDGVVIDFAGTATDTEDGDLSSSIEWTSSLDGSIGMGASVMTTLSIGTHLITATATDSGLETGTDEITVTVTPVGGIQTAVFINEIHYDNDGGDEGEAVEIAGPAGTDLSGWSLVFYNGNGGTEYGDLALSGILADDGSGFGFLSFEFSGIQNGSPDGIVLFDGVNVIQFLSYEGDFIAVGGVADGMMSTDIGVTESGATPVGNSLQLSGTGTFYEDFTWETDAANTFGAVNNNQAFDGVGLAFINEIHYDNDGSDEGEAVEIAGPAGTDLSGWSLFFYNGSNGTQYGDLALSGTLADDGSGFGFLSFDFSGIQNGAPDGIVLYDGENVVEFLSYEGAFTAVGGVADGLESTDIGVSESGGTPVGNSLQLVGTGTKSSDFSWATDMANTFGAVNTGQVFSDDPVIEVVEIFDIQGPGLVSPFENLVVRTENNVVTAVGPVGFFIQTPGERVDGDVNTSDGIYVFVGSEPGVAVGDLVDVEGKIEEFFDLTEFTDGPVVTVVGTGTVPDAIVFDDNLPSTDQPQDENAYERYEGMLVTIPNGLVSGPSQSFGSDPEAEAYIVANGVQPFREPGIEFPGLGGLPVWDGNPEVFEIDPDKLGLGNVLFTRGSTFSATGALAFEFGEYELWASELTVNELVELPVPVRAPESNEATIATLNLFRFGDGESDEEVAGRASKFSEHIRVILQSPDILGVQEVVDIETLSILAAKLNEDDPSLSYEAFLVEGNDLGGIDVGFLVNTNGVIVNGITQLAADETLTFDGSLLHDRPPLLLEADINKPGFPSESVQVLVVHNRSFNNIDDPNDGERVRTKRLEQAQSIAAIVQDIQSNDPSVKLAVIGDFNDFEFSDGYVDMIGQISGNAVPEDNLLSGDDLVDPDLTNQVLNVPAEDRYSFIFRGSSQVLDHVLTTTAFNESVSGIAFGRGNAGAPEVLVDDYTTPLAASDHDGLVMYIMLEDVIPGTAVLAAENSIYIDRASAVLSGDVLVANDAEGDVLGGSNELVLDRRASIAAGFEVKADGITVFPDAVINSDVFYNGLENFGTINGTETSPLDLPAFNAPEFPVINPGSEDVNVPRNTSAVLDAGSYGEITVRKNSTLTLTGGEYHIENLEVLGDAHVVFEAATDLRIAERVTADLGMIIGPADGSGVSASDIIIYVGGMNGTDGGILEEPLAVSFGNFAEIDANIYAPNGSIVIKGNSTMAGSFIAKDVQIGRNTAVTLDSYWATLTAEAALAEASMGDDLSKESIAADLPKEFALGQNYPNPFNPTTAIPFSLPEASHVKLQVYDMLGRLVDTIVDGEMSAGYHNASFDASRYPSGTYIYRIEASNFTSTAKMVLVK